MDEYYIIHLVELNDSDNFIPIEFGIVGNIETANKGFEDFVNDPIMPDGVIVFVDLYKAERKENGFIEAVGEPIRSTLPNIKG